MIRTKIMKLIVGLGNIGKEYEHTNHNAGFDVLDLAMQKLGVTITKRGFEADYGEAVIGGEKVFFAKPRTFMNDSGRSVASFQKMFKLDTKNILVISDDIDLEPGKIRIRKSGSAGTHNGLKSIIHELQSEDFVRVRVGIGKQRQHQDLADFVLSKMTLSEPQKFGLEKASEAVFDFANGKTADEIMAKYNGSGENGKH